MIKRPLQYAAMGGIFGAPLVAVGAIAGRGINNIIRKRRLDDLISKRKDWGIAFRKASGNPDKAIETLQKYKKGFVPKAFHKDGIGDIDLVWGEHNYKTDKGYGLEHIIARRKSQGINIDEFLKKLPDTIKNGIVTTDKNFPTRKYIEDPVQKISIELNWNDKKRKWLITAFNQNKSASKRLMKNAPLSNITTGKGTRSIPELVADNNIINDINTNFKPSGNYFGGDVPNNPNWLDKYIGGEKRPSKLPQSMRKAGTLPPEMQDIRPEYEVLHNADLANQAAQRINETPNDVYGELLNKSNSKADLSALDFETARQTVSKLYQEGRIEKAIALSFDLLLN